METEHPVSTAIWQPQVALANKDKLYLFIFTETHFYDYSKPKWDFGIESENYYQVLHKCRDSFWKVTAQWNREPIIHLLPQRVLRLHRRTMTVSSCKDWGEIRSGNKNQHPFRQTGLQFPGTFFRGKDGPCSFPWGQCCCRPRREGIQSSCCTNEKMAPAPDWNMSWWHETAALAAFCPIIHQHLPPTGLVKGCLRLFVVLQEVSSRAPLLHSRLGFLSHLASAMPSERRFHLQALCHEGRKLPATSVLCRDDDTACLHACSLTLCLAFVAHTEKAYWLPLPSKNTHEKNNSLFSHEYAALQLSLGFKLVFSEAAHWNGQWEWRNTGLPVTCNWALHGRDEHKLFLFSPVIKSKGLHHGQEDSKNCCSFFFMPGSYFLWKTLLISMQQLSTPGRRKEDLLPTRVLCMWHSPITDLLDIRQLWSSPVLFSSKCVKLSPQLELPMALIHGAKFTHASCSHLIQRDFND